MDENSACEADFIIYIIYVSCKKGNYFGIQGFVGLQFLKLFFVLKNNNKKEQKNMKNTFGSFLFCFF